ncbi:MAG: 30S ribosomal protein S3 [Ardenticatenaceae bacterium]
MGRKVHPVGFRLGVIKDWNAKWYAEGERYADLLQEDLRIRKKVRHLMGRAGISNMVIERFPKQVRLIITTAKPGIIIGRKGANIKKLKEQLEALTNKKFKIDVEEISSPDSNAYLIAESIAQQIERRVSHRRAMKQAIQKAMRAGAKGIRISVGGRLGGGDMARREDAQEGRVPRHTLRADIDYASTYCVTTYSKIGVKVWVYNGEVL